jgi:dTDP-4-dehydrorhamnose reductase
MRHRNDRRGPLELWGGVECTVNRVGDRYHDQLARSGHDRRDDDLERFAALGLQTLRYPLLWERIAPDGLEHADWSWADRRLDALRRLGLAPIAGLVHHGSGPRWTDLTQPAFAEGLGAYAAAVARRYPWIDAYTPVNEPLTTARFSGLYGHWHPHGASASTFVRCLLVQCRATVLAMQAIRAVNPAARLVQTDDLGKTHSTRRLAHQADFENERRWIAYDLIAGRVDRWHPLWRYLRGSGAGADELAWFLDHPCPPDIIGVNHYLTSERFLDEQLDRYPRATWGGNGRDRYADVEAVRVPAARPVGPAQLLWEAWERYRLPLAVTEAHIGSAREEQLRWLQELWDAAEAVRRRGADVRAVTVWALLGLFDWDSLVTREQGHYEAGVFDLRADEPRPTALAAMARALASGRRPDHPVLAAPGWWRRGDRFIYEPPADAVEPGRAARESVPAPGRALLVTGGTGTLGRAFARLCRLRGLAYRLVCRQEMDIADRGTVERTVDALEPWAVVNTAGYARVDDAERDALRCFRANRDGPGVLAEACARHGLQLVTFSSDLVFDGRKAAPYVERDEPAPLSIYGRSKAESEARVLDRMPSALVVRTGALFGPRDPFNSIAGALDTLAAGGRWVAPDDVVVSPTYLPDLVHATLDLLIDGAAGIWHLVNVGAVTWADFARRAARLLSYDPAGIEGRGLATLGLAAPRPLYSALSSERATLLAPLEDALGRFTRERVPIRDRDAMGVAAM